MLSCTDFFPAWPVFEGDEIDAVSAVLQSGKVNYWTGTNGRKFEAEFASFCGVRYAIAVASGSVGLELALIALDVGAGDDVIVTPRSFVASANAAVLRGARPIFADVDVNTQNISAATIKKVISEKTKAIIVVHLAGWPADMDDICELAKRENLKIIEDCAQALGATFRGRPVGSFGDVGVFSFCQDKIITTGGEGGMVVTGDSRLRESGWAYKDHGRNPDTMDRSNQDVGFRWLRESFGTNFRMTEIQAVIGRLQLKKLPDWKRIRKRNASILTDRFSEISALRVTSPHDHEDHSYYKYYVFVRPDRLRKNWSRDRIIKSVNARGVPCFSGSCPEIYLERAYVDAGLSPKARLIVAERLSKTSSSIEKLAKLHSKRVDTHRSRYELRGCGDLAAKNEQVQANLLSSRYFGGIS